MDDRRKNYRAWGALRSAKSRSRRETPCQKTTWCSSCWISSRRWISRSSTSITPRSKDWIDFLRRKMGGMKASSEAETLHRLMKFVLSKNYWNEFVLPIITIKRTQSRCRGCLI